MTTAHDFEFRAIDGGDLPLSKFKGKALLVVNVASQCGLTPQYSGLEALWKAKRDKGLVILGVPANDFGAQEPGTENEIKTFCETNYGVSFPMFAKVEVNGGGRHPLYAFLTAQDTKPDSSGDIQWNFAKFLCDRSGKVVARFAPTTAPAAPELVEAIEALL